MQQANKKTKTKKQEKKSVRRATLLAILFCAFLAQGRFAVAYTMNADQANTLTALLQVVYRYHVQPTRLGDLFSEKLYSNYINSGDSRRLFWRSDVEFLSKHKHSIDDQLIGSSLSNAQIKGTNLLFLSDYVGLVRRRAREAIEVLRRMSSAEWDYESPAFYEPNPARWSLPTNAFGAQLAWEVFVRHEVLNLYHNQQVNLATILENKPDTITKLLLELSSSTVRRAAFLKSEPELRKGVIDHNIGKLERLVSAPMGKWFNAFLKAFVAVQDPSSSIVLGKGEAMEPVYVNPYRGVTYPINQIEGYGGLLASEGASSRVRSGRANIALLRGLGEAKRTYGYLGINVFYKNERSSSSQRVAEVLARFESNQTMGFILDLRNNSGGYSDQVLEVLGYLLGRRTIGYTYTVKANADRQLAQKGSQRAVASLKLHPKYSVGGANYYTYIDESTADQSHNKPIVVLVNELTSAGAESLAAVLKDLQRAVVVGQRTLGRSVGHSLASFSYPGAPPNSPSQINLAIYINYRLNGDSLQGKGLLPDIPLPSAFSQWNNLYQTQTYTRRMSALDLDLPDLSTQNATFEKRLSEISLRSKGRVLKSAYFQYIRGALQAIETKSAYEQVPVNYMHYMGYRYRNHAWARHLVGLRTRLPRAFGASAVSGEVELPPQALLNELEMDPYVVEAYRVLDELANKTNKGQ